MQAGDAKEDVTRRRGRRGRHGTVDSGQELVSRQLDEIQQVEATQNGGTQSAHPTNAGRSQISFLQQPADVEIREVQMSVPFGVAGHMEAIVECEERSPSRSPQIRDSEASKRTEAGRRSLMAREKISSQIEEIEALEGEHNHDQKDRLPSSDSFYFSHTPDMVGEVASDSPTGSTSNVLEAVKQQLLLQQVNVDVTSQLGGSVTRSNGSHSNAEDLRRTKSSSDVEAPSTPSSKHRKEKSNGAWGFRLLRASKKAKEEELVILPMGLEVPIDSAKTSPLRRALTLKTTDLIKPMMSWVGVGSGRSLERSKPDLPDSPIHLTEEEEVEAARPHSGSIQRAMGGELFRPLNDLAGQYTFLGENESEEQADEEGEEKKQPASGMFSRSASLWQWYTDKAAQVRISEAARSNKLISRMLVCARCGTDDAQRDQDESSWMANGVQYVRCFVAFALVVLDLVAVLVFQVFWGDDNFLCHNEGSQSGPHGAPVALLCTSTTLYFLDFCYLMASRDATGKFAGLSYFKKGRDVVARSSQERRIWNLAVFVLSTVFLVGNVLECNDSFVEEQDSYRVWVLHRCLFFFLCLRTINAVQICSGLRVEVKRRLRIAVSQNKRRFVSPQQEIDLDLTYVCDRLIGMSLPCVAGVVYRNDIADVARFFRERHYGKYKVYNLCEAHESRGNGNYECSLLYHQVQKFPFRDHNAPPLETLINFCEDATAWLNEQSGNVVAVHCQGGKGRTGTFCSSLMLWVGHRHNADEAMKYFELRRRDENKGSHPLQGVTAPSQIRYVSYLERVVRVGVDAISKRRRLLRRVVLREIPPRLQPGCKITFIVEAGGVVQYDHGKAKGLLTCPDSDEDRSEWVINIGGSGVVVYGDVAVRFFVFPNESANIPATQHQGYALRAPAILTNGGRTITYDGSQLGEQLCFVQFHSTFHEGDICFSKEEIDGVYNKSEATVGADFALELMFGDLDEQMQCSHDRAVRNCSLARTVHSIMERVQPRTRKFYKGEIIYDHMEKLQGRRVVRYIVSGIAKQYMTGTDETKSAINNGVSLHGECIGAGEFDPSGILAFIMGHGCINPGTELRAWTEVVEVRELIIGGSPIDMITHLTFHNATPEDSALVWELIAYQLSSTGKKSWVQKKEVAKNVDEIAQHRIRTVKLVKEARNHFSLPSGENLLGTCAAERVVEEEGAGVTSVQGHVIALQNWLLFREGSRVFKDKSQDLMVSFENITKVLAYGRVLSVHLSSGASDQITHDTAIATTKPVSPPRSPMPGSPRYRLSVRRGKPVEPKSGPGRSKPSSSYSVPRLGEGSDGNGVPPMQAASGTGRSASSEISVRSASTESQPPTSGGNLSPLRGALKRIATEAAQGKTNGKNSHSPRSSPTDRRQEGGGQSEEVTRLHFRARDSHNASSICAVLQTRLADLQAGQGSTLIRSALYGPFGRVRPGYMGFGYAYPGEVVTEGDEDFLKLLAMASTVCNYHAGETMVHLGTTDRNVLHILTGWVVCYTSEGEQVAQLGPGEIMGEVSFLEMGSLGARTQCVAHTDVECRVVSYAALQVLSRQPLFAARFYRGLAITCAVRCLYSLDSLNVRRRKFSTEMPVSDGDLIDHSVD